MKEKSNIAIDLTGSGTCFSKPSNLEPTGSRGSTAYATIASFPGLARLIPGTHDPHRVIESAYGRWQLPTRFRGEDVALYRDGALLARRDR